MSSLSTLLKPYKINAAALGVSEQEFFIQEVLKIIKGGSSTVVVDIRAAALSSGMTDIVSLIDAIALPEHSHLNKTTLDVIDEAFTTALKSVYDGYATGKENTNVASGLVSGHESTYDHTKLHNVSFLGTKQIDEAAIGEGKVVKYDSASGKLIYGTSGGGGSASISSLTSTIAFSAETSKDFDITATKSILDIVMGRLYINANPGAAFFDTAILSIYSHSDRKDDQILFMATVPVIYNTFASGASIGASSIAATDASHFATSELIYLFGASNEHRRILTIVGNTINIMSILVNAYLAADGISNVNEFGNQSYYDALSANKIYCRLTFPAAKTVSMKLDLTIKS